MISFIKALVLKYWAWGLAVLLAITVIAYSNWQTRLIDKSMADTQQKIEQANTRLAEAYKIIDKMHDEHDAALEAANAALKERMEIYEAARDRICEAEKRINGNSAFCDQLVPDDIVRLWKEQDAARMSGNPVPATD